MPRSLTSQQQGSISLTELAQTISDDTGGFQNHLDRSLRLPERNGGTVELKVHTELFNNPLTAKENSQNAVQLVYDALHREVGQHATEVLWNRNQMENGRVTVGQIKELHNSVQNFHQAQAVIRGQRNDWDQRRQQNAMPLAAPSLDALTAAPVAQLKISDQGSGGAILTPSGVAKVEHSAMGRGAYETAQVAAEAFGMNSPDCPLQFTPVALYTDPASMQAAHQALTNFKATPAGAGNALVDRHLETLDPTSPNAGDAGVSVAARVDGRPLNRLKIEEKIALFQGGQLAADIGKASVLCPVLGLNDHVGPNANGKLGPGSFVGGQQNISNLMLDNQTGRLVAIDYAPTPKGDITAQGMSNGYGSAGPDNAVASLASFVTRAAESPEAYEKAVNQMLARNGSVCPLAGTMTAFLIPDDADGDRYLSHEEKRAFDLHVTPEQQRAFAKQILNGAVEGLSYLQEHQQELAHAVENSSQRCGMTEGYRRNFIQPQEMANLHVGLEGMNFPHLRANLAAVSQGQVAPNALQVPSFKAPSLYSLEVLAEQAMEGAGLKPHLDGFNAGNGYGLHITPEQMITRELKAKIEGKVKKSLDEGRTADACTEARAMLDEAMRGKLAVVEKINARADVGVNRPFALEAALKNDYASPEAFERSYFRGAAPAEAKVENAVVQQVAAANPPIEARVPLQNLPPPLDGAPSKVAKTNIPAKTDETGVASQPPEVTPAAPQLPQTAIDQAGPGVPPLAVQALENDIRNTEAALAIIEAQIKDPSKRSYSSNQSPDADNLPELQQRHAEKQQQLQALRTQLAQQTVAPTPEVTPASIPVSSSGSLSAPAQDADLSAPLPVDEGPDLSAASDMRFPSPPTDPPPPPPDDQDVADLNQGAGLSVPAAASPSRVTLTTDAIDQMIKQDFMKPSAWSPETAQKRNAPNYTESDSYSNTSSERQEFSKLDRRAVEMRMIETLEIQPRQEHITKLEQQLDDLHQTYGAGSTRPEIAALNEELDQLYEEVDVYETRVAALQESFKTDLPKDRLAAINQKQQALNASVEQKMKQPGIQFGGDVKTNDGNPRQEHELTVSAGAAAKSFVGNVPAGGIAPDKLAEQIKESYKKAYQYDGPARLDDDGRQQRVKGANERRISPQEIDRVAAEMKPTIDQVNALQQEIRVLETKSLDDIQQEIEADPSLIPDAQTRQNLQQAQAKLQAAETTLGECEAQLQVLNTPIPAKDLLDPSLEVLAAANQVEQAVQKHGSLEQARQHFGNEADKARTMMFVADEAKNVLLGERAVAIQQQNQAAVADLKAQQAKLLQDFHDQKQAQAAAIKPDRAQGASVELAQDKLAKDLRPLDAQIAALDAAETKLQSDVAALEKQHADLKSAKVKELAENPDLIANDDQLRTREELDRAQAKQEAATARLGHCEDQLKKLGSPGVGDRIKAVAQHGGLRQAREHYQNEIQKAEQGKALAGQEIDQLLSPVADRALANDPAAVKLGQDIQVLRQQEAQLRLQNLFPRQALEQQRTGIEDKALAENKVRTRDMLNREPSKSALSQDPKKNQVNAGTQQNQEERQERDERLKTVAPKKDTEGPGSNALRNTWKRTAPSVSQGGGVKVPQ